MLPLEIPVTEGDELDSLGKLLKGCPVCAVLLLSTVNYKYLMTGLTMMTKLIDSEHWDSIPFPGTTSVASREWRKSSTRWGHTALTHWSSPAGGSSGSPERALRLLQLRLLRDWEILTAHTERASHFLPGVLGPCNLNKLNLKEGKRSLGSHWIIHSSNRWRQKNPTSESK